MAEYHPVKRQEMATWILAHIQYLLKLANDFRDPTMVIYACFETRNFLEKIEFYVIMAALPEEERLVGFEHLRKKYGLNSGFATIIKEQTYPYITFLNALSKAKNVPFEPLGYFDFKIATKLKLELNEYCHLYSKLQADLAFESKFIQDGLKLPERVFSFLKDKKVLGDHGITISGISPKTLKGESLAIFEKWKRKEISTEEELIEMLKDAKNE